MVVHDDLSYIAFFMCCECALARDLLNEKGTLAMPGKLLHSRGDYLSTSRNSTDPALLLLMLLLTSTTWRGLYVVARFRDFVPEK